MLFRSGVRMPWNDEMKLISSDQEVLQHIRLENLVPQETYHIKAWCVHDDDTFKLEHDFVCPGYNIE